MGISYLSLDFFFFGWVTQCASGTVKPWKLHLMLVRGLALCSLSLTIHCWSLKEVG